MNISDQFVMYLLREQQEQQIHLEGFAQHLEFLLSQSLISNQAMLHYLVRKKYDEYLRLGRYPNKAQAVQSLALEYNLHENSIYRIIATYHRKKNGTSKSL